MERGTGSFFPAGFSFTHESEHDAAVYSFLPILALTSSKP
jgi:hypothetical protein